MQEILKEKQKMRLTVLHKLHELSLGDIDKYVNGGDLATACEVSDILQFKIVVDYLEKENLVNATRMMQGFPALIRITHQGILEVEDAFLKPDQASTHFLPVNVLYVHQMFGSAIQQGTINSTQSSSSQIDISSKNDLMQFIELASKVLENAKSDTSNWHEMKSDVDTLRAQAESPNPKRSIIKESLNSLGRLCENSTAGAIGTQLATYIPALLAMFS